MLYTIDEEKTLVLVVGILLVVYLLLIGFGIASYIMNAVAYQKIASRRLISNPWLAWIPVASSWVLGSIADEYDEKNGLKRKWRVVLLTLSIISIGGILISYVGFIVAGVALSIQPDLSTDMTGIVGSFVGAYVIILVAAMAATANNVCNMICLYKIFESTVPEKSVKYLLLSLLVPLGKSICLLRCRNQGYEKIIVPEPVYPTYAEMPQQIIPEEAVAEDTISEDIIPEETTSEETSSEEMTSEE